MSLAKRSRVLFLLANEKRDLVEILSTRFKMQDFISSFQGRVHEGEPFRSNEIQFLPFFPKWWPGPEQTSTEEMKVAFGSHMQIHGALSDPSLR